MSGFLTGRPARIVAGAFVAGALGLGATLAAQQPTFRASTQVVSLFATVTDAQNRLVPELTKDDFTVLDNDKPQELLVFQSENQPITVVVMLDTSGSMTGSIALLKAAAEQFVTRLLPDDKAAVGAFNDKIELSASFSNDRDAINESLNQLRGIDGRRVILVFTDGDDTSSRVGRGTVMDRARAEEVMIYAIGFESEYF